jgi:hypothetical protein
MSTLQGNIILTTQQKNALGVVQNGTICYDKDLNQLQIYNNGWIAFQTVSDAPVVAAQPLIKYAKIADLRNWTSASGTFSSGLLRTRALNTKMIDEIGITLSANTMTFPAGRYHILARCPAVEVNSHRAVLYDNTNDVIKEFGTFESVPFSIQANSYSVIDCFVTIDVPTVFTLRHRGEVSRNNHGFGWFVPWNENNFNMLAHIMIEQYA